MFNLKMKLEKFRNKEQVTVVLNSEKKGKRVFTNHDSFWKTLLLILRGRR